MLVVLGQRLMTPLFDQLTLADWCAIESWEHRQLYPKLIQLPLPLAEAA